MSTKSFYSRPYRVFLSYSRRDAALAKDVQGWLENRAGLRCFYDEHDLEATDGLIAAIRQRVQRSQSYLLLLSSNSVQSRYVEIEGEAAIEEQRDRAFRMVLLLTDDIPKDDLPAIYRGRNYFRLPRGGFDAQTAAQVLRSLYQPVDAPPKPRDTFITRSWRTTESALADQVCKLAENEGLRLIGDMPDWEVQEPERIRRIMASCGCYLAILPYRDDPQGLQYMLPELEHARNLGLPRLVVADRRLEDELDGRFGATEPIRYFDAGERLSNDGLKRVRDALDDLSTAYREPTSPYVLFYTTGSATLEPDARRHIEQIMHCITGATCTFADDAPGNHDDDLIEQMSGARAIIADVGNGDPEGWFHAGLARGAGKTADLHVLAQKGAKRPRTFVSVHEYENERDRLGLVHRLGYPYRRRVLRFDA